MQWAPGFESVGGSEGERPDSGRVAGHGPTVLFYCDSLLAADTASAGGTQSTVYAMALIPFLTGAAKGRLHRSGRVLGRGRRESTYSGSVDAVSMSGGQYVE